MKQLADSVYQHVMDLCKQGDKQVAEGQFEETKDLYLDTLLLLPSNHQEWEAATWIYVAVGDAHLHLNNNEKDFKAFYNALQCRNSLCCIRW